jgi:hypothetical protein
MVSSTPIRQRQQQTPTPDAVTKSSSIAGSSALGSIIGGRPPAARSLDMNSEQSGLVPLAAPAAVTQGPVKTTQGPVRADTVHKDDREEAMCRRLLKQVRKQLAAGTDRAALLAWTLLTPPPANRRHA